MTFVRIMLLFSRNEERRVIAACYAYVHEIAHSAA